MAPFSAVGADAADPIGKDLVRGELTHRPFHVAGVGLPVALPNGEPSPAPSFADSTPAIVELVAIVAEMLAG